MKTDKPVRYDFYGKPSADGDLIYYSDYEELQAEFVAAQQSKERLDALLRHRDRQLAAIITWVENNEPGLFKRGLWDAFPKDTTLSGQPEEPTNDH